MTTQQQLNADRIIQNKGTLLTLATVTTGAYDPAQGFAPVSTSSLLTRGVVEIARDRRDPNHMGERKITLSGLISKVPALGDQITIAGESFKVNEVMPVYSGDAIVIYTVWARKA